MFGSRSKELSSMLLTVKLDLEKANEQANPDIDPETAARGAFGENGAKGSRKWVELPADPVFPVRLAFVEGPDGEVIEFFHER